MPRPKTKSSARKRFKVTTTGKVLGAHAGKCHGMIKRIKKQIRDNREMVLMAGVDTEKVRKQYLPCGD